MNMPVYDYSALIDTYIQTRRQDFIHEDFLNYYQGLLKTLEELFGIRLSAEGSKSPLIWMLFLTTVTSYLSIGHPWAFLDSGLFATQLEEDQELYTEVDRLSRNLIDIAHHSQENHLELLHVLFIYLFGQANQVFTSDDLLRYGFDDSLEPQIEDYDHLL